MEKMNPADQASKRGEKKETANHHATTSREAKTQVGYGYKNDSIRNPDDSGKSGKTPPTYPLFAPTSTPSGEVTPPLPLPRGGIPAKGLSAPN